MRQKKVDMRDVRKKRKHMNALRAPLQRPSIFSLMTWKNETKINYWYLYSDTKDKPNESLVDSFKLVPDYRRFFVLLGLGLCLVVQS